MTQRREVVITGLGAISPLGLDVAALRDALRVAPDCLLNPVVERPLLDRPVDCAMSYSSGLGGTNVALVVANCGGLPGKAIAGSQPLPALE